MEDPDKDVRIAFSGNIKYILESLDSEDGFIKEVRIFKLKFKTLFFINVALELFWSIKFASLGFCFKNEGSIYTCPNIEK